MSHNRNVSNPGSNVYGHPESPHRYHAGVTDETWTENGGQTLHPQTTTAAAAHTTHDPRLHGTGERVVYTEKVTKIYDDHGNVISSRVEHPPPLGEQGLEELAHGGSGTTGAAYDTTTTTSGRQAMVSDEYGRTGVGHFQKTTAESTGPHAKPSLVEKIVGKGEKPSARHGTDQVFQ